MGEGGRGEWERGRAGRWGVRMGRERAEMGRGVMRGGGRWKRVEGDPVQEYCSMPPDLGS